ncbi:MAG: 2-hydroxyacid dehydrogenase [bacterium]|nr:2-hydroxyacid dehydrogenase [bacterium]
MENTRIAFFDAKPYDMESFDEVNKNYGFEIKYFKNHLSADTAPLTKGFDTVCIFVNDQITGGIVPVLADNGIRLIALRSAGYNNIDLKAVFNRIHVVRVPAYSPHAVAEHAVALMLSLNRKMHRAYYRTRDHNFSIAGFLGFDMFGKTAGIIGTGLIGKTLIRILKGFGMKILAYDVHPDKEFARETECNYTNLDALYSGSDIISLHCPLTAETRHLINEKSIAQMKPGVMLINTGRGPLIDTKALIKGLKTKKIGYAGLDVYEEESEYFFEDLSGEILSDDVLARLLTFNNVLITSHQGFFTKEALHNIAETTLKNIRLFLDQGILENEICYQCGQEKTHCNRTKNGRCF